MNIHGCDLPATLMGASPGNEYGHWESQAIAEFNDELLESAGSHWDDVQSFNDAWYTSPRQPSYSARAKSLFESEFGQSPLFVLKDPRICRIAPFWLSVMEESGVEPAIILPIRQPRGVADSLERRDERPSWYGSLIWLRHVLDAEYTSRGYNRVFSSFDLLLNDWRLQIDRIVKGLGLHLPRMSPISAHEADQFIKAPQPEQPFSSANVALSGRPEIRSWLNDSFTIFDKWIRNGEQREDQPLLDKIRSDFDHATFALGAFLLPGNTEGGAERGVRRRIDLQNQLMASQSEVAELREHLANATAQVEQLSAAHTHSDTEMDGHVAARDAEVARLAQDLAAHQHELAQRDQTTASLASELSARSDELAQASSEIVALGNQISGLQDHIGRLENVLQEQADAKREYSEQLSSVTTALALRTEELALQANRLEQREIVISQYREEVEILRSSQVCADKLQSRLIKAEARVGRLTADRRSALTEAEQWRTAAAEFERRTELLSGKLANAVTSSQSSDNAQIDALRAEIQSARQESITAQQELRTRFEEIAKISAILLDYETQLASQNSEIAQHKSQIDKQRKQLDDSRLDLLDKQWLLEMLAELMRIPSWWHVLPTKERRRRERDRLSEAGLFDAEAYVARYPDVGAAGFDPLKHYITHGMTERRDRSVR